MSRQDDRFRKTIRLVSEAAQGRKIKTFCGAVIGNSQKVFFIWRASCMGVGAALREGLMTMPSFTGAPTATRPTRMRGERGYDWEPIEDFAFARRAHRPGSFHRTGDRRSRGFDDRHLVCRGDELRQLLVVRQDRAADVSRAGGH